MVPADTGWTRALLPRAKKEGWSLTGFLSIDFAPLDNLSLEINTSIILPSHCLSPASSWSGGHSSTSLIDLSIWLPFYSPSFLQLSSLVLISLLITCYILTSQFLFTLSVNAFIPILFLSPIDLAMSGTQLTPHVILASLGWSILREQGQIVFKTHILFYYIPSGHEHLSAIDFTMLVGEEPSVVANQHTENTCIPIH